MINPRYTGSVTTSIPITTPTSSTSYTSSNATAYGTGGSATAYGNSTTTTYGNKTTYIPITVNRVDYGAVFFVKQRFRFGAFTRDLSDAERRDLQSNQGAAVEVIVDDSPAFDADILVGDIVTALNGHSIANTARLMQQLGELQPGLTRITLIRDTQRLDKQVLIIE